MSSEEEYAARADAKFEELYNAAGQPAELDEAFANQYFESLAEGSEDAALPGALTTLNLVKNTGEPLSNAVIAAKGLKFVVNDLVTNWDINGASVVVGIKPDETYKFTVKLRKGFVHVSIKKSLFSRAEFISFLPHKVPEYSGEGKWKKI